jgi:hypothetical protein
MVIVRFRRSSLRVRVSAMRVWALIHLLIGLM